MCSLCPLGAVAAVDGNCEIVPEEAHRDPGASAAGVESRHTGEEKHFMLMLLYLTLLTYRLNLASVSSSSFFVIYSH